MNFARGASAAALAFGLTASGVQAAPEAGVWLDHKKLGAIEIAPCGPKLCGRIVWVKDGQGAKGRPLVDAKNPDPSKRKRAICGLPVVGDLKKQPGGSWDAGWVYDPKEGKQYDLEIKSAGRDRLTVTGYLGSKFFSQSMTWTRAPASLQKCGGVQAAKADAAPAAGKTKGDKPREANAATAPKSSQATDGKPPAPKQDAQPPRALGETARAAIDAAPFPSGKNGGVETAADEPALVSGPQPATRRREGPPQSSESSPETEPVPNSTARSDGGAIPPPRTTPYWTIP